MLVRSNWAMIEIDSPPYRSLAEIWVGLGLSMSTPTAGDRPRRRSKRRTYPILEYDPARVAMIEPSPLVKPEGVPECAVICFFNEIIAEACGDGQARLVGSFRWELGVHPLYDLEVDGRHVAVFHPGVGAPLAVGIMEEAIAYGCHKFIAVGGAGAIAPGLALGHIVVPTAAVRDEGTSYHYLPPAREVAADEAANRVVTSVLDRQGIPYTLGKTWTTDAPYRETRAMIERRRQEGCITVEMECAAFMAVASHRGVRFAQMLYAGDDVSGEAWDERSWTTSSARHDLFWLGVESALNL